MSAPELMSRRRWLRQASLASLGVLGCGWAVAACHDEPDDQAPPWRPDEGWMEVALAEHPALAQVGGWASVERPERFFQGLVVCVAPGRYIAAWRICTHGACPLEARPLDDDAARYLCPCHGSTFDADGQVLRGPATEPLPTFEARLHQGAVWIRRAPRGGSANG